MSDTPEPTGDGTNYSLYERVGGEQGIKDLVVEFYVRVMADPELAPFFRDTEIERLHRMQREFFSAALDGPIEYTGRPLHSVHAGRGIQAKHMKLFVDHMLGTLERYDLSEEELRDIISRINTYADEIMGGYGTDG